MGVIIGGFTMVIGIIVMLVAALKIVFFIGTTLFALSQSTTTTTNNQLQPYVKRDIMMEAQEVEEVMEDDNNQLFLPMVSFIELYIVIK